MNACWESANTALDPLVNFEICRIQLNIKPLNMHKENTNRTMFDRGLNQALRQREVPLSATESVLMTLYIMDGMEQPFTLVVRRRLRDDGDALHLRRAPTRTTKLITQIFEVGNSLIPISFSSGASFSRY